jgi:putative transcriptional regulator
MKLRVNLDYLLIKNDMTLIELSKRTQINISNLSVLKSNKARAIRFSTLIILCETLKCTPGELLTFE